MVIGCALLTLGLALSFAVTSSWLGLVRKVVVWLSITVLIAAIISLLVAAPGIGSVCLAIVTAYSIVNMLRFIAGRTNPHYLFRSATNTAIWLGVVQVVLAYYIVLSEYRAWPLSGLQGHLYTIVGLQCVAAAAIFGSTYHSLRKTVLPADLPDVSDSQLPTVTVAVPVRNEGRQLEACLTSILSSNYPKLEVLAFDDNSLDNTPDIIRSFAHSGVRFLRSAEPSAGWLAKNQAYDHLARAASGQYILFCGADIRLGPRSIRQLVALLRQKDKHMLAAVPRNQATQRLSFLQAMRYYWELAPPRRLFHRPPVLSSCWIIDREALQRYGGFAAVRQSMSSEAHLAYRAAADADGYSFVRSDERLGITSEKTLHEQQATALLRRYPQVHRRPELVLMYSIGQALLLLGAPVLAVYGALSSGGLLLTAIAGLASLLHTVAFGEIQRRIFPRVPVWKVYAAVWPTVAIDIWYLNRSMILYEFASVTWKGRDIAKPVMRSDKPADS